MPRDGVIEKQAHVEESSNINPITDDQAYLDIDKYAKILKEQRKNPLLVLYYPATPDSMMRHDDITSIYNEFRRAGFKKEENRIPELDVLIHTLGGHADVGYMIAQVIRTFSDKVNFLIPFHSASAGTLTCLSGNKILFGAYAYLTPIDVSLGDVPLMSLDYFTDFAVQCRRKMERAFHDDNLDDCESNVESDILVELVKQISGITIGKLYRERTLTGYYAQRLLHDYMFADSEGKQEISNDISRRLIFEYPAHEFNLDYTFSKQLGLPSEELIEDESDIAKKIIRFLDYYSKDYIICKKISDEYRMPFIKMYK